MKKPKKILDNLKNSYNASIEKNNSNISFSFKDTCKKNCLLEEWKNKEDLKKLNNCFKIMSSLDWTSIKSHNSLYFKSIPRTSLKKPLPEQISEDETIYEVRIGYDSSKRLFGYRNKNVFHVIWFDLDHQVVPYNKNVN